MAIFAWILHHSIPKLPFIQQKLPSHQTEKGMDSFSRGSETRLVNQQLIRSKETHNLLINTDHQSNKKQMFIDGLGPVLKRGCTEDATKDALEISCFLVAVPPTFCRTKAPRLLLLGRLARVLARTEVEGVDL